MEKYILQWSYWLGVACLVIALVWRVLNAAGSFLPLLCSSQRESSSGMGAFEVGAVVFSWRPFRRQAISAHEARSRKFQPSRPVD